MNIVTDKENVQVKVISKGKNKAQVIVTELTLSGPVRTTRHLKSAVDGLMWVDRYGNYYSL